MLRSYLGTVYLSLLKSIVKQSEGRVWFESEEGKGTTFHVLMSFAGMKKKSGTSRLGS